MTVMTGTLATRINEHGRVLTIHTPPERGDGSNPWAWVAWCAACDQTLNAGTPRVVAVNGVEGRTWCEDCGEHLSQCDRWGCTNLGAVNISYAMVHTDTAWSRLITTVNDLVEAWCPDCIDDYSHWCDCGDYLDRVVSDDHVCDHDDYDDYYDDDERADGIHDYGYRPTAIFHRAAGQPKGQTAYLGLELEAENTECSLTEGVEAFWNTFGSDELDFYLKYDSSVDGFEMVSHPRTIESWVELEPRLVEGLAAMRRAGMRSWNAQSSSCGIHVHISRKAFDSDRHLWLFQQLFYRNADVLERYAGRDTSQWGNLKMSSGFVKRSMDAKKQGLYTERYVAINLNPTQTVECRIFRGSLNPDRVLANIELVHAAMEYARTITSKGFRNGDWKFDRLAAWAIADGRYPHILAVVSPINKNPRTVVEGDEAA